MNTATKPITPTFTDPYAEIDSQPVTVAGQDIPTKIAVRVKDDTGEFQTQAILGKDYQLFHNRKVRDITEDILSRTVTVSGGWKNLKTLWDGKRYVDFFSSVNPIVDIGKGGKPVQPLHIGLMAWNAYNGERKTGFEIFALNPFCTNQYHSRNRFGFFAWKHTQGIPDREDICQSIGVGVQNLIAIAPRFTELRNTALTIQHITDARQHTDIPVSKWGNVLDQLAKEEGSVFGLYQALTFVASHQLSGLTSISIGSSITDHLLKNPNEKEVMNHDTAESIVERR